MRAFLNTKIGRIAFFMLVTAGGVWSVYSFIGTVRETHMRYVEQDLSTARTESQRLPPGFPRAEDYLRRLKAIKTHYAPPEMQQALSDFIAAYERGLIATEAGRDAPEHSQAMADAKARIVAVEEKYK